MENFGKLSKKGKHGAFVTENDLILDDSRSSSKRVDVRANQLYRRQAILLDRLLTVLIWIAGFVQISSLTGLPITYFATFGGAATVALSFGTLAPTARIHFKMDAEERKKSWKRD